MRTFVVSVPKSGTYLLRELLEGMGQGNSHLHIDAAGLFDYSKISEEEGRRNPSSCLKPLSFKDSLDRVTEFALSHMRYTNERRALLKDFTIILLTRDFKEVAISGMVWCLETGRRDGPWKEGNDPEVHLKKWLETYGEWIAKEYSQIMEWRPYAHCFDYHELVDGSQRLADIYGYKDIEELTKKAIDKKTLTKVQPYDKTRYWNDETLQIAENLISTYDIGKN